MMVAVSSGFASKALALNASTSIGPAQPISLSTLPSQQSALVPAAVEQPMASTNFKAGSLLQMLRTLRSWLSVATTMPLDSESRRMNSRSGSRSVGKSGTVIARMPRIA